MPFIHTATVGIEIPTELLVHIVLFIDKETLVPYYFLSYG
jgi:hypothetical protein